MNTITLTKKTLIGIIITSLIGTLCAFTPLFLHVANAKITKNVDLSCMQTAIDAREEAIADAFETYNDDITAALTARKTALHDAWGLDDATERTGAIKNAWKTWKTDHKSAHTDLKKERKAVWATFKTTAKTSCKETLPKDESLGKDSSGSVAL